MSFFINIVIWKLQRIETQATMKVDESGWKWMRLDDGGWMPFCCCFNLLLCSNSTYWCCDKMFWSVMDNRKSNTYPSLKMQSFICRTFVRFVSPQKLWSSFKIFYLRSPADCPMKTLCSFYQQKTCGSLGQVAPILNQASPWNGFRDPVK